MKQHKLGNKDVSAVGIGLMNVSWIWSNGAALDPVRRQESAIPAIHAGLDAGITLLDTADIYAPTWDAFGHNEIFAAEALRTWSGTKEQKAKVVIATKAGITRQPGERWGRNGTLDYLLRAAEASAGRLGVDKIDLWQHHRLDPDVVFETQFSNVLALKERGIVDQIGVSNYDANQLEIAVKMGGTPQEGGIVSVQNELSPRYRADLDVLDLCERRGIAFLPWSPLGGASHAHDIGSRYSVFADVARELDATAQEVTLAWLLRMSPVIIPIPGATRPQTIDSIVQSLDVHLTDEQFDRLQDTEPEHTSMYPEDQPRSPLR